MENLKNYNILCIDDNEFIKEVYKNLFSMFFNKVYIASNGKEGLKIFKENNIDIILTDEKMPEMNGIKFIQEIRKKHKNIPIILVSGSEKEEFKDIKNLNIFFIKKPLNKEKLLNILQKIKQ